MSFKRIKHASPFSFANLDGVGISGEDGGLVKDLKFKHWAVLLPPIIWCNKTNSFNFKMIQRLENCSTYHLPMRSANILSLFSVIQTSSKFPM